MKIGIVGSGKVGGGIGSVWVKAGYEPIIIGGLEMGKHLIPGTPLSGEHTPDEIMSIVANLD